MTSKEALESLYEQFESCTNTGQYDLNNFFDCFTKVKDDLTVLEILKKYLVVENEDNSKTILGDSVNCYLKNWISSEKDDFAQVKDWLDNTKETK